MSILLRITLRMWIAKLGIKHICTNLPYICVTVCNKNKTNMNYAGWVETNKRTHTCKYVGITIVNQGKANQVDRIQ